MIEPIRISNAPGPAGPYSQGIAAAGLVFTAGFGPQDPETGAVAVDVRSQTLQVLKNVMAVLAERGLDASDVVKVTCHLQHLKRDYAEFNAAYREVFADPFPARTTVGSDLMDILVEIDVVALERDQNSPAQIN
jgi:2-iminobutanoate/2-iminopropanoate deaminase